MLFVVLGLLAQCLLINVAAENVSVKFFFTYIRGNGRLAWSKGRRPPGALVLFSPKWTRVNSRSGSLAPATRQHYKHCRGYYYYYYYY